MKVSVIGAGPAGSTAAYWLAKAGIETELIDKVEFPRDKPCAGGLFNPPGYYKEFPYLKEYEGKYIHKVEFSSGNYQTTYLSDTPLLKMVLRREFDYFLLTKALDAGAHFYLAKRPMGNIVIDATGVKGPGYYPSAGISLVYNFPVIKDVEQAYISYGFGGVRGYAWLYPKKGYANIGIGAYLPQKNIREIFFSFIDHLVQRGIVSIREKRYTARVIPFAPVSTFFHGNHFIVGDAAGMVNPATGEGIYFAMLSGKYAAQAIVEGRSGNWYETKCRDTFGEWLAPVRFVHHPVFLNRTLARAIQIASHDEKFNRMLAENFFRLGNHRLILRFIVKTIKSIYSPA